MKDTEPRTAARKECNVIGQVQKWNFAQSIKSPVLRH